MNAKTLIIAEAGVNHNGDLELAKKLIDVAADAGADIVKFQTFKANTQVTKNANKANYQINNEDKIESQFAMLSRLELTKPMHYELRSYCNLRNIDFLSTGFDIESVNFLSNFGQSLFKIPSGEITNLPYLRHIGKLAKSVIISTGMSSLGDIEAAINVLECAGLPRFRMYVMHCTTEYPAPIGEVNLRAMQSMHSAFGVNVGYSDHTDGIEISIAAVAMGAHIIEKHFTLDRNLPGPDHRSSLEPNELKMMIKSIRNVELALGDGIKKPSPSEIKNLAHVRKSLVAIKKIKSGEAFTESNVGVKRPGTGISPMRWDEVMGKRAFCDFEIDELIKI